MESIEKKYLSFFETASIIYDGSSGYLTLINSIKKQNISSDLNSKCKEIAYSILGYFLVRSNDNLGKNKRLFKISDLHIKGLAHQCEKAELFSLNIAPQ